MKSYLAKASSIGVAAATAFQLSALPALAVVTAPTVNPGQGFAKDIGVVINGVLSFVMVIAALLVLMYLIWGAVEWITSGGDKGKTESARNKITAAVIGIIILAASYAIFLVIINFLGFSGFSDLFTGSKGISGEPVFN